LSPVALVSLLSARPGAMHTHAMNSSTVFVASPADPSVWQQAIYAFLAEKHRRSGSMRTVQSYSGGVPEQHRADHLSAAIRPLDAEGWAQATARYEALMAHYGVEPTTNNAGVAHENGDVEQSHHRFKVAVDQALRVRGSRDFPSRATYLRFLHDLVRRRNLTRQSRWQEEQRVLRPLPVRPLRLCRELRVAVTPFSTIRVLRNTYSVPSRLIGSTVTVRVRSETVELYHGATHLATGAARDRGRVHTAQPVRSPRRLDRHR
jgi:hypothetical protein